MCYEDATGESPSFGSVVSFKCDACGRVFRKNLKHFATIDEFCPLCGEEYMNPIGLDDDMRRDGDCKDQGAR